MEDNEDGSYTLSYNSETTRLTQTVALTQVDENTFASSGYIIAGVPLEALVFEEVPQLTLNITVTGDVSEEVVEETVEVIALEVTESAETEEESTVEAGDLIVNEVSLEEITEEFTEEVTEEVTTEEVTTEEVTTEEVTEEVVTEEVTEEVVAEEVTEEVTEEATEEVDEEVVEGEALGQFASNTSPVALIAVFSVIALAAAIYVNKKKEKQQIENDLSEVLLKKEEFTA